MRSLMSQEFDCFFCEQSKYILLVKMRLMHLELP